MDAVYAVIDQLSAFQVLQSASGRVYMAVFFSFITAFIILTSLFIIKMHWTWSRITGFINVTDFFLIKMQNRWCYYQIISQKNKKQKNISNLVRESSYKLPQAWRNQILIMDVFEREEKAQTRNSHHRAWWGWWVGTGVFFVQTSFLCKYAAIGNKRVSSAHTSVKPYTAFCSLRTL